MEQATFMEQATKESKKLEGFFLCFKLVVPFDSPLSHSNSKVRDAAKTDTSKLQEGN